METNSQPNQTRNFEDPQSQLSIAPQENSEIFTEGRNKMKFFRKFVTLRKEDDCRLLKKRKEWLKEFDFSDADRKTHLYGKKFLRSQKALTRLSILTNGLSKRQPQLKCLKTVSLGIYFSRFKTLETFIRNKPPNLKALSLSFQDSAVIDKSAKKIISQIFKLLPKLNSLHLKVFGHEILSYKEIEKMEFLRRENGNNLTNPPFYLSSGELYETRLKHVFHQVGKNLKRLQHFGLFLHSGSDDYDHDKEYIAIEFGISFSKLPLKSIFICLSSEESQIVDKEMIFFTSQIERSFKNLRHLTFHCPCNGSEITDEALNKLASQIENTFQELTTLDLSLHSWGEITDTGIINLATQIGGLKNLKHLSLALKGKYWTEKGIEGLASHISHLVQLQELRFSLSEH